MQESVRELVRRAVGLGGLPVDDVLALALPLLGEVHAAHETGRVAALRGLEAVELHEHRLGLAPGGLEAPTRRPAALAEARRGLESSGLELSRGEDLHLDLTADGSRTGATDVSSDGPAVPRIVAGWQRWEHLVGHHDPLTDVGSLGELLAALLCGLDLADVDAARKLAAHRRNLYAIAPSIHPVVATTVTAMLEPDRHRRSQDLGQVAERLATYRDQPEDFDLDRVVAGAGRLDRRAAVLTDLRDRLFDLSRRNPLLHFRRSASTLDVTEASVPLVLDVRSVRPEQLFTWGGAASARLVEGKTLDLGSLVRWDDAPYAEARLNDLVATARRDRAEYGHDQLRLVVAFLRWHDVHDDPDTPILSPLVLAAAEVTKKRGVRQSYRLSLVDGSEAEVNPVLRHQLREVYGFRLPETIDLRDAGAIEALRADIERQARASERGVEVTLVDKPRVELIRSRAETMLRSYRRRQHGVRPSIGRRQYAYSYTRPGWAPLGIQIVEDRLQRRPLPLAVELGDSPAPRQTMTATEQEMFSLETGRTNPYSWELDLCAVTLANFSYRTLSLVRDYDELLAAPRPSAGFDELFSAEPRQAPSTPPDIAVEDRFLVVPADDSQLTAIAQARADDNFVIQGPPGTGKSQTITNLVLDHVARGKRVLFVCQKRAALDVVHARLRSRGLDEICSVVHDSQADKKEFVHGLRATYEAWLDSPDDLAELRATRDALAVELAGIHADVGALDAALAAPVEGPDGGSRRVADLVDRLVELRDNQGSNRWVDDLTPSQARLLPDAGEWLAARPLVDRLAAALVRAGAGPSLAASAAAAVDPAVLADDHAEARTAQAAEGATSSLARIERMLADAGSSGDPLSVTDLRGLAALHDLIDPLVRRGAQQALDPRSPTGTRLEQDAVAQRALAATATAAATAATGWQQPLSADDARAALAVAEAKETGAFRWFSGDWRRVRTLVEASFADPSRQVPPTVSEALRLLVAHHDAQQSVEDARAGAVEQWGQGDLDALVRALADVARLDPPLAHWRDEITDPSGIAAAALATLGSEVADLDARARGVLVLAGPLDDVRRRLSALAGSEGRALVRGVAPALRDLAGRPGPLAALRELDVTPDQLEHATLTARLRTEQSARPALDALDGPRLAVLLDRAAAIEPELHLANARLVTGQLRDRFKQAVEHSTRSVTGMSSVERIVKQVWTNGRRELEHEFGKVRAYKSIRRLSTGDPGAVVAALRPVWLVSPSSLSDTLDLVGPEARGGFDIVIFDEASQVPVEEAVPALYRAEHVVVVGDRMQLPPTRYFRTARTGPESSDDPSTDGDTDGDAESAQIGAVLDADSFLAVASVRLPSTMLTWHYRSRYEALIQYSNAAFYEGRLATVPDRALTPEHRPRVQVEADPPDRVEEGLDPDDVRAAADAVLDRAITHVRVTDGTYAQRTNAAEAAWVAALVREILGRKTGLTLGVVAFSEAQQGEIESALDRLASADPDFATAYEDAVGLEHDGQAVGLFVKNLENVQGDERDVIIMSVCYAPGPDGRIRMNFGPINNAGGEKRLNVIFSRAREHMVVVSSIEPQAITNVYNDGANTLRGFLRYAEAVSENDAPGVAAALGARRTSSGAAGSTVAIPPLVAQLAAALEARGLLVATGLGQSGFRCDLALRAPDTAAWHTAVLVDHARRLDRGSVEQRRFVQPQVLASAGWHVEQVLGTEWLERPEQVLDRLVAAVAPDA